MIVWLVARVREPRVERFIMLGTYLLALVMGASALVAPPDSVQTELGQALAYTWAGLLCVCGVFGAYGVVPGLWWAERVAVNAGVTGAAIYAAVLMSLDFGSPSSNNRLPVIAAVWIVVLVFVGRGYKIRGVNYEPRPEKG